MKNTLTLFIAILFFAACNQPTPEPAKADNTPKDSLVVESIPQRVLPPGPVAKTVMTEEYVKQLAGYTYLWAWPMVNIHNTRLMFKDVKEPMYMQGIVPVGPLNGLCMLTDYIDPFERVVACPNQDVAYGFGLLDFSLDAVVIQVPDFGDRFWVYQICDQRTDGFANIGKMYGTKPGFYLLTGPGWKGTVPDGIAGVFKCSTQLGAAAPRLFISDDPADKQAAQPVIQQIMMYPLAQFDGKMKTIDWTKIPKTPAEKTGDAETKWVNPETFFDELPAILKEVPPQPGEEALYAQIQALLDGLNATPKLKDRAKLAADDAEKKLVTPLFQFVNVGYPLAHHWSTQSNGAQFGVDYLTRTACAKANIFVNKPSETKYFYQDLDSTGTRLNGNNKYTVTFAKGAIPPVKGFWSLTLYNQHHFFSKNALNRYSLGTKNKDLQYNADGSLTFYVQSTPPDENKKTNWLPAPKEPFSLYVRGYWPEEAMLNDTWTPPPVVKVK